MNNSIFSPTPHRVMVGLLRPSLTSIIITSILFNIIIAVYPASHL